MEDINQTSHHGRATARPRALGEVVISYQNAARDATQVLLGGGWHQAAELRELQSPKG